MISTETLNNKIHMLPPASQKAVLDYVDELLEKSAKSDEKKNASAWENWARSHSDNLAVVDDDREALYEDD